MKVSNFRGVFSINSVRNKNLLRKETSRMISFLFFAYLVVVSAAEFIEVSEQKQPITQTDHSNSLIEETDAIEKVLEAIEKLATIAEKSKKDGVLGQEHTDAIYDQIVDTLNELIDILKTPNYAYKFLNLKGIDRVITPILSINYEPLKKELLILLKILFNTAPVTTKEFTPINIIDKLLDIFENDDNLALKTHALELMYVWLPENPKVQARIMKIKGLEPFYEQISKLDASVTYTLLDLFNVLIKEHVNARDNKRQRNKDDFEAMVLYERIGLIERISSPAVCNGLLNIFEGISFRDDVETPLAFFDLLKNIQPFCFKYYIGKLQATKVFESIKNYLINPKDSIDVGYNVSEVRMLVEDYIKKINGNVRDEF